MNTISMQTGQTDSRRMRAALSVIGVALLLVAATAHGSPGGEGKGFPPDEGRGPIGEIERINPHMLKELKLSADQEKKLKETRLVGQKKKIQLFAEKATLELDLKNILTTYPINKPEAMKLAEKIAEVEKRMTVMRVDMLTTLLGGLTAEQHAKLQQVQEEWSEKRRAWRDEMRNSGGERHEGKRPGGEDD